MRKTTALVSFLGALATTALSPVPAHAAGYLSSSVPPPKDKIVIDVATVNGTGCPAGTAAISVSPDNTAFTVTYSAYTAQVGKNVPVTDSRKNCQLNLAVHLPSGFTYAIAEADYRGFASLAAGATASEQANYYFQGFPQTTQVVHNFTGPLRDIWATVDKTDVTQQVFEPCGVERNFNINITLRVDAGTSDVTKTPSYIQMDSTDGSYSTIYHFAWQKCP